VAKTHPTPVRKEARTQESSEQHGMDRSVDRVPKLAANLLVADLYRVDLLLTDRPIVLVGDAPEAGHDMAETRDDQQCCDFPSRHFSASRPRVI
jgi:hypothetical protein